jgi:hypothetical protein
MKEVISYLAEDGEPFANREECAAYELRLPIIRLLKSVEDTAATDADFALKIEAIGRKLAKDRVARGERLRAPKARNEPEPEPVHEADAPFHPLPDDVVERLWPHE